MKFIGTGGARFVVASQMRSTGGLWLNYRDTNLYIDPGPGALVRVRNGRGELEPAHLDGIILTHKHLDHSNDVNVMVEAMTEGGHRRRGVLFCPEDALGEEGVVLRYLRKYLERIELLGEKGEYIIKDVVFSVPVRHVHPGEVYGMIFNLNKKIGLIADTRFFEELPDFYPVDVLIVNVLRVQPIRESDRIDHLSLADVREIVSRIRPEVAIMTHFGMSMLKDDPEVLAKALQEETGVEVVAAYDEMIWRF